MTDGKNQNEQLSSNLSDMEGNPSECRDIYQLLGIPTLQNENLPIHDLVRLGSDGSENFQYKYQRENLQSSDMSHWLEYEEIPSLERLKLPTNHDTHFNLDLFPYLELPERST